MQKKTYEYEAMFLISQAVAADLKGAVDHINEIIHRGHGKVIAMKKWDERRLAYEIRGQKRGLYILCYFSAPGEQLSHIERDCNLSEKILRTLILRADHLTAEQMQAMDDRKGLELEAKMRAERPAVPAPQPAAVGVATEGAEAPSEA
jgi:small subunit ribosomal protein S6